MQTKQPILCILAHCSDSGAKGMKLCGLNIGSVPLLSNYTALPSGKLAQCICHMGIQHNTSALLIPNLEIGMPP
jgi:hypothetical protein